MFKILFDELNNIYHEKTQSVAIICPLNKVIRDRINAKFFNKTTHFCWINSVADYNHLVDTNQIGSYDKVFVIGECQLQPREGPDFYVGASYVNWCLPPYYRVVALRNGVKVEKKRLHC